MYILYACTYVQNDHLPQAQVPVEQRQLPRQPWENGLDNWLAGCFHSLSTTQARIEQYLLTTRFPPAVAAPDGNVMRSSSLHFPPSPGAACPAGQPGTVIMISMAVLLFSLLPVQEGR